jgi:transcription termination/antitermination protein NusA
VHYPADRTTELLQLLDDVVLAIAAMNHDGKVVVMGEGEVSIEPYLLFGERSAVPVPVEAGFSDGDEAWAPDHIQNEGPILLADFCRVVGMDAGGGENTRVFGGEVECPGARGGGGADGDDLGHAFLGGALEDGGKVGAKSPIIEVGVGIDQWAGCGCGAWGQGIHGVEAPVAGGFEWGFRSRGARPQSLQGKCLSIVGLLDSLVNVVLNSSLGPGLENSFVGLGPLGAWARSLRSDCRVTERRGGSKEVLLALAHRGRRSEPYRGGGFRRVAPVRVRSGTAAGSRFRMALSTPRRGRMSVDLVRIVDSIHRDKNISKDILFEGIQSALTTAARKHYPEAGEIDVRIDPDSGSIEATKDGIKMDPSELGRIAAQTAKQVIIQKIREAERDSLFDEFEDQRSDLVTGTVQRFEGGAVIVNLGKTDAILPRSEQIPGESYHPNERIRAIILDVRKVGQRVKIILSRTHPDFVRRLFELEIPEIADQIIAIRALAREAGYRSKVAVTSIDTKVDAVGACVGVRGTRIKNIVDELGGERIDIVRWNESLQVLIPNALQPAEIDEVMLCHLLGRGIVLVRDDQLSLAIGRRGQNVRLASKLVGWDIEIMTAEELEEVIEKAVKAFEKIDGVDVELAERLVEQGILSYDDLSVMEISDLVNTIEGMTEEQTMEIVARAEVLAEEQTEELPRRKGSRGSSSEPAPVALTPEEDTESAVDSPETVAQGDDDFGDPDSDEALAAADAANGEQASDSPTESTASIDGEPSSYESAEADHDLAGEEEIHDVALAVETSSYSPQGHEVTSPPSENDQGEGIRIVTEAVEQIAAKRVLGASTSTSRADRAAESAGDRSGDDS